MNNQRKGLKLFMTCPREGGRFEFESSADAVHERAVVALQARSPNFNASDVLPPQGRTFVKVKGPPSQAAGLANDNRARRRQAPIVVAAPRRRWFQPKSGRRPLTAIALLACLFLQSLSAAGRACAGELIFVSKENNDVFKAVTASTDLSARIAKSAADAVESAAAGDAVLILADRYPGERTPVDAAIFDAVAARKVRLFVEYPAWLPGVELGEPVDAPNYRGIIVKDWFGDRLKHGDLVTLNGLRFLPTAATDPIVVAGKVAGYDRASFGAPDDASPILFQLEGRDVLAATTKLSHCVTARNAPVESWQVLWSQIIGWLVQEDHVDVQWTPVVRPCYASDAALPRNAEEQALHSGIAWFEKAKLILTPSLEAEAIAATSVRMPVPPPETPTGDGSLGSMEGVVSTIDAEGQQLLSTERRGDCICETAMALALAGEQFNEPRLQEIATNLVRFYLLDSPAQQRERGDESHGAFGLVAWGLTNDSYRANYGDDNARVVLSSLVVSAVNKNSQFDSSLARCLLANLRTTGRLGFRGNQIYTEHLAGSDWQHYYRQNRTHLSAHHEAYLWACYLWAYEQSGEELFLRRAVDGIERMMATYPHDWRWANGLSQERARILLPLAWLVRVQDTPHHRELLQRAVDGLLDLQVECGAIREELGPVDNGVYPPPESNEAYGSAEAPLIAANGDPVADLLYTTNFALVGLHEAAAATGDARIRDAENKLVDFLCRIQISAPSMPYLDGGWFRAFDFRRWEYFGSNADHGWGAWSIESGWTQAWITAVLAMRAKDASLWDLTQNKGVGDELRRWAPQMLPAEFRRP